MKGFDFIVDKEKIKEIMSDDNLVFFLGMIFPRRPGVFLFATKMEYMYFPPNTEKNEEFIFGTSELGGTIWAMMGIPKENLSLAKEMAGESGLRIADGIPHLISGEKITSFPIDRKNIFSLENTEGHKVYGSNQQGIDKIIKEEDQEIKRIVENPQKYRKEREKKRAEEPKVVEIDWDND